MTRALNDMQDSCLEAEGIGSGNQLFLLEWEFVGLGGLGDRLLS